MSIDWFDVFNAVCGRASGALEWGLTEPWMHAELYAELRRKVPSSGWEPIPNEVPYVTYYPVSLPKKTNRDWISMGGVKWVDLCLYNVNENAWCWFEFKLRHTGNQSRQEKASKEARDAFRKDVIALVGFDSVLTAQCWEEPDKYTNAFWFEDLLKPKALTIKSGKHSFVAAYMQLNGQLNSPEWSEKIFRDEIESWLAYRNKSSSHKSVLPNIRIDTFSSQLLAGGHSLLVCEWESWCINAKNQ